MERVARAPRYRCHRRARLHVPTGGTLDATVLDISASGALFAVRGSELGLAGPSQRLSPSRALSRRLPSDFMVQFWSLGLQKWVEGRIVSRVRVADAGDAGRIAATFQEPLSAAALQNLGVRASRARVLDPSAN